MQIETDKAEVLSGITAGITTGAPIAVFIANRDHKNWTDVVGINADNTKRRALTKVRPGHADASGIIKYGFDDARFVLERASARETAASVAAGAICKAALLKLGISVGSHTKELGGAVSSFVPENAAELIKKESDNDLRCHDPEAASSMRALIDEAVENGDTLGGITEIVVTGLPVGVGSYVALDRKLDFLLAGHIMGVNAVKCVEIGEGRQAASKKGSEFHDEIELKGGGFFRATNRAGGIEGGMSNGSDVIIKAAIKPIPTLRSGLATVDIITREKAVADNERSDVCAVPAAGVVLENVTAYCILKALLDTFGGDTLSELYERVQKRREQEKRW